ncbi:MAG TPA: vWA domain-containing protein, partial [Pirellulaceae bacterium]|nr:vWA domain-containing protein [Pirellulaceae bacterium]
MIRFAAASWDSMFGWLANKPHPEGEGIQRSFEPTWTGPPWLTLLLLILLALFLFRVYRNEPLPNRWRWFTLAAIRFSVLGLVVFMLYGWVEHRHRTELPELVIAVDVSKSMAMVDAYRDARVDKAVREYFAADPSRFGQAKSLLTSSEWGWLESLKQHYRVKIVTIGDTVRELPPGDDGGYGVLESLNAADVKSRLGDAMREIIDRQRGRSTAAIVLLTDGITTDGAPLSEAAVYAQSKSLPLHLVGLGSEQPPRDVRLSDLLVDDV